MLTISKEQDYDLVQQNNLKKYNYFDMICVYADDSGFLGTPVDVTRIQGDVLGKYIICEELGRSVWPCKTSQIT